MKPRCLVAVLVGCLSVLGSSSLFAADCANRSPAKIKGHPKWKISGMIFGQHGGADSLLTDFYLGGGLPEEPIKYYSNRITLKLDKTPGIAEKIRLLPNPLTIQFAIPYVDHGGSREGFYDTHQALDAWQYYEIFEHTQSHGFYGKQFREACKVKEGKKQKGLNVSGYIVRVERKGFSGLTRSCNITINKGGTRKEWRRRVIGYREKETCVYRDGYYGPSCRTEQVPIYQSYQDDFPVTELLIAHSEEACAYAEDTGRANVRVKIDFSKRKRAWTDPNTTVIHGISVLDD